LSHLISFVLMGASLLRLERAIGVRNPVKSVVVPERRPICLGGVSRTGTVPEEHLV